VRKFSTPIYGFCVAINAIGYAMHSSRSHDAVIRVYDEAGKRDRNAGAQGRFQRVVSLNIALRQSHAVFCVGRLALLADIAVPLNFNGEFGNSRDASVEDSDWLRGITCSDEDRIFCESGTFARQI
jgi:hypothetical protein